MEKAGLRDIAQDQGKRKSNMLLRLSVDEGDSEEEAVVFSKLKLQNLVRKVNSHGAIVLNIDPSQMRTMFVAALKFFALVHSKHLNSTSLSTLKTWELYLTLYAANFIEGEYSHSAAPLFDYPVKAGARSNALNACSQSIPGSIMQSQCMRNILKSHLFQKIHASDRVPSLKGTDLNDVRGFLSCNSPDFPKSRSVRSPHKLVKETLVTESHTYGPESTPKRLVSISSISSTVSDCSSSGSEAISRGMIQCTWKGGTPRFVFSVGNGKEVYVASLRRAEHGGDNVGDNSFLFHLSKRGRKEKASDTEPQLVGKMNVSTHFSVCPNNLKVRETEYVLYTSNGSNKKDVHNSVHIYNNNKQLPKKMVELFKTSISSKHRTLSRFDGASLNPECCQWVAPQISRKNTNDLGIVNMLEPYLPSNYESAAIVMKEHFTENLQEEVGGWGLKFLKKSAVKQGTRTLDGSKHFNCCNPNSIDILIPAGLHGGPKTGTDGPSSLTERWRSGGDCDCGGWDTGCPLTVLMSRTSKGEALSPVDTQGHSNSLDLYIQGWKNSDPTWRMVNVHDGSYFMNFQHPLSALQSFSIAVAIIHRQSPNLRPVI